MNNQSPSRSLAALALVLGACAPSASTSTSQPKTLPSPIASSSSSSPAGPSPFVLSEAKNPRLPDTATPLRYDLTLHVDPRKTSFTGETKIDVRLESPSDHLVLHARAMTIEGATVDKAKVEVKTRRAFGARDDIEELVLVFGKTLNAGEHAVEIRYAAPFNGQLRGLYRVEQGGRAWAFTQLESIDARRMFPGFDEPRFKTPFVMHVEIPDGMKAVSNSAAVGETKTNGGVMVNFAPTLPLPTYLVALAVGDLEITEGPKDPVPIRLVTVPGKGKLGGLALDAAAAYLKVFGAYFDRAYPYPKLDIVAVPDFGPGAMENAGLVTFREELLLLDPKQAPMWAVRRMEAVMAHELAHQWFGDLVTMKWWDDIWLNEGFATWLSTKGVDTRKPETGALSESVGSKLGVMGVDAQASSRPVRIPIETTDAIFESSGWTAYVKGQAILRMLESYVGPDQFRDGLRSYVKSHEWGIVTSDDLIASLSKSSGKDLAPIARSFLDQPGVPLVEVDLVCDAKGGHAKLHAGPLNENHGKARSWTIPVCLKVDGAAQPVCTRLDGDTSLDFTKCPTWIYPNAAEQGYYRYTLAPKFLTSLAKAAQKSLSDTERAALVSNTWALVQANKLDIASALDVLLALAPGQDSSRLVLEQTIGMLGAIRETLLDEKNEPKFRAFVAKMLSPVLKRIGVDQKPTDTEEIRLLRIAVTGALFDLADDAGVQKEAEKRAAAWLKDPKSVDADLAALALRISSRSRGVAKEALLFERLAHAEASERVILVGALASSGDMEVLKKVLKSLTDGVVRAGDFRYIYNAAARRPDSRKAFTDWTLAFLPELRKKLGGVAGLVSLIGWTCEKTEHDRVSAFWKERLGSLEGAQRAFDESTETSLRCMGLREREGAAFSKWLATHGI